MKKRIALLLTAIMCFTTPANVTYLSAAQQTPDASVMCTHPIERVITITEPHYSTTTHTASNNQTCTVTTTVTDYRTICISCGAVLAAWSVTQTKHSVCDN